MSADNERIDARKKADLNDIGQTAVPVMRSVAELAWERGFRAGLAEAQAVIMAKAEEKKPL